MAQLLTTRQAAERAGLDPSAFRHAIRRGRIHAVKDGRVWRFTPAEVARYRRLTGAPPKGWVTSAEAARRMGRSRQRIHQLIESGALPARRTSTGRVLVPVSALPPHAEGVPQ